VAVLTLAEVGLSNLLPDDATGVVDGGGRLELHRLGHTLLHNGDLEREGRHGWRSGLCRTLLQTESSGALEKSLRDTRRRERENRSVAAAVK
jgi:hypothetical protein